jgi:hypothetical protein
LILYPLFFNSQQGLGIFLFTTISRTALTHWMKRKRLEGNSKWWWHKWNKVLGKYKDVWKKCREKQKLREFGRQLGIFWDKVCSTSALLIYKNDLISRRSSCSIGSLVNS